MDKNERNEILAMQDDDLSCGQWKSLFRDASEHIDKLLRYTTHLDGCEIGSQVSLHQVGVCTCGLDGLRGGAQ